VSKSQESKDEDNDDIDVTDTDSGIKSNRLNNKRYNSSRSSSRRRGVVKGPLIAKASARNRAMVRSLAGYLHSSSSSSSSRTSAVSQQRLRYLGLADTNLTDESLKQLMARLATLTKAKASVVTQTQTESQPQLSSAVSPATADSCLGSSDAVDTSSDRGPILEVMTEVNDLTPDPKMVFRSQSERILKSA